MVINFNFRKINILNILINNEFVEIDILMKLCDISMRTAISEINLMNEILLDQPYHVQIMNQRGKGYFLDYSIEAVQWIESLKNHCRDYINLSINYRLGNYDRVAFISRLFLVTSSCIKGEDLAERLNVSIATLNKDLRIVRKYFNMYDLQIISTPYYGMKLLGDELAIRSCMIDFCDIYNFSEENIFEQQSLNQYHISRQRLLEVKRRTQNMLKKFKYSITDIGFKRLVIYLLILPLRLNCIDKKEWKEKNVLKSIDEYFLAKELIGENSDENELMYLTIFILSNIEIYNLDRWETLCKIVPESKLVYEKVLMDLKNKNNLDLVNHKEIEEYLLYFFYKRQLRKKYNIYEYEIYSSRKRLIKKIPSSLALAVYIYHYAPDTNNEDYNDILFGELVIAIYNLVYKIKNEYNETNIILINENGFIANNAVISRLKLQKYNVKFHYHYLYEIDTLDYSKYDYLFISDSFACEVENIPIPKLKFDFFFKYESGDYIWNKVISKHRKVGSVSKYLQNPVITSLSYKTSQLSSGIANFFIDNNFFNPKMSKESFAELIFNIIDNADYDNFSTTKYVNLFTTEKIQKNYFVFNMEREIIINNRNVKSIHFIILDLSKGPVEIKNGDSEIRRYTE